jgi:hypothetical protein
MKKMYAFILCLKHGTDLKILLASALIPTPGAPGPRSTPHGLACKPNRPRQRKPLVCDTLPRPACGRREPRLWVNLSLQGEGMQESAPPRHALPSHTPDAVHGPPISSARAHVSQLGNGSHLIHDRPAAVLRPPEQFTKTLKFPPAMPLNMK